VAQLLIACYPVANGYPGATDSQVAHAAKLPHRFAALQAGAVVQSPRSTPGASTNQMATALEASVVPAMRD